MIGIDTNLLLRLIVGDDPKQAVAARDFLRDNCSADEPGYVCNIVLVEMVWTLARAYGFTRDQIADAIEQVLETAQLDIESSNDVAAAVKDYRSGTADFADCLLVRVNSAAGCTHTATFDRKPAKLAGFELLIGG
jgi:predicted nucleic-acid-binding protein